MKTRLESCIEDMKNGWGIGIEYYPKHKTTVYSFMKVESSTERSTKFECAKDVAKLLIKNGAKIVYVNKDCFACNFIPERIQKGMITYYPAN